MTDAFTPPALVVSEPRHETETHVESATPTTTKRGSGGKRGGNSRKRAKRGSNSGGNNSEQGSNNDEGNKGDDEIVEVAAHLSLLGDSLTAIGDRLNQQHVHGPVALGPALSVLLDSLLCSLAPLITLTRQVDALNGADEQTITTLLDDVAYIMPGL